MAVLFKKPIGKGVRVLAECQRGIPEDHFSQTDGRTTVAAKHSLAFGPICSVTQGNMLFCASAD